MDQGISPEVVRSVLAERANWPCLASKSAHKVSWWHSCVFACVYPSCTQVGKVFLSLYVMVERKFGLLARRPIETESCQIIVI